MHKMLKYLAIAAAALLALLLIAVGIVAATFNPNDYKPLVIRLLQEKKQRTLSIPGDIKLSFFPKLGADLGQVSISEHNSSAEFAAVGSAKVSLALLPLLAKQVVVDQVRIEGLRANITRFKDGSTNIDDLLAKNAKNESSAGQPVHFDIDSIHIGDAHLTFDDRQQGRKLDLAGFTLDTGKIADRVPGKLQVVADIRISQPEINAKLAAKTGFTLDLAQRHYTLNGLDAELKGKVPGFSELTLKLAGAISGDIDKLLFTSPQLALTLSGKQGSTALSGSLTTALSANLKTQLIELSMLTADFTLPNPAGSTLTLKTAGNAGVNLGKQTAAAQLNGSFDQSRFDAKLGLRAFSPAAYTFDVGIDQLDLDRYKRKAAAPSAASSASAAPPADQPVDFAALQNLRASGSMRIGAFKIANIRSSNVRFDLRAAGGKLDVNPLAASLYGGTVAGSLSLTAKPVHIALRQTLSGINLGPLLKDAIGKEQIEGRGIVQLDVNAGGASASQLRKNLNGSARLELRDGAIRGVNIAQTVRSAKARIGELRGGEAPQSGTASAAEKTDFSEMSGSFRIVNGIAHNDDLNIKSPLIRVGGAGDINLGDERLDYVARTTVVPNLQGQGGPELQALKGVTVPVKLSGPFNAIGWRVDFAGMATELAKKKFDDRKEEAKAKAQKSLDEEKAKIRDQLKDQLKGLFGK